MFYSFQEHTPEEYDVEFRCLQYALFVCCFFQLLGSFAFLAMSWYVMDDKRAVDEAIKRHQEDSAPIVQGIEGQDSD